MIDGGIWANNPVMNALVDALACFDIAREDVRILSLGTGESTFTVDERARNGGIKDWAFMRSFNAAARAQSRSEEHTSELQSLMRISYAVFCLKTKKVTTTNMNKQFHDHHKSSK